MEDRMDEDDLHAILSDQLRQFRAAKTLDSDLDMAFNLQMQEAMAASLALALALEPPSTSRFPPPSPRRSSNNDAFDLSVALMLDDAERFELQCEDHKRSVLAKCDVDRWIHNQNFAMGVADMDWQRPYFTDGASSSSKAVEESQCLRLYFKGLVSEERVKDINVIVAGVGVAICDPRDNLIFEAKKNLEAFDGSEVLSNGAVELEALVEGLNKALALDLKNVTFHCDDNKFYQYVTNTVLPENSKIVTLVNQVALLQSKFEHCSPSLVKPSDIKFAFQLAREAVVSQITWPAETRSGKRLNETCVICFEETDVARMFSIDGCLHRYCYSCMKQHVEAKLLNGSVVQCPHEGCKSEVSVDSCETFLEPKQVQVMRQQIKESSIPVTEKVYCPNPRCSALMSKSDVLEYTNTYCVGAEQSGARKCMKCHYYFCINCKVPWHNQTCYDYKKSHPYAEEQLVKSIATKKLWRQCVKCSHMVELADGCYHITCRCGYEFCYTCGAEWKNKKPTCSCTIWDERNIIRQ